MDSGKQAGFPEDPGGQTRAGFDLNLERILGLSFVLLDSTQVRGDFALGNQQIVQIRRSGK
jgi:hypothetical protein